MCNNLVFLSVRRNRYGWKLLIILSHQHTKLTSIKHGRNICRTRSVFRHACHPLRTSQYTDTKWGETTPILRFGGIGNYLSNSPPKIIRSSRPMRYWLVPLENNFITLNHCTSKIQHFKTIICTLIPRLTLRLPCYPLQKSLARQWRLHVDGDAREQSISGRAPIIRSRAAITIHDPLRSSAKIPPRTALGTLFGSSVQRMYIIFSALRVFSRNEHC